MRRLLILPLALCSLTAAAQLYQWKDAQGKIHYSDAPPPDKAESRRLNAPPGPASDPNAARRSFAEQQQESKRKQKEAQDAAGKAEKEKADAEERRANCERARAQLAALESGQVRFTYDSKGERVALDGATREAELENARKTVDSWCK